MLRGVNFAMEAGLESIIDNQMKATDKAKMRN